MAIGQESPAYAPQGEVVGSPLMRNITRVAQSFGPGRSRLALPSPICPERCYLSGRTTPRIGMEPAPATVTSRPGRGACTIEPSPMYIPTWVASS